MRSNTSRGRRRSSGPRFRPSGSRDLAGTAPLLCAGIIGYRAYVRSAVPPGGRLGIYGFGGSAHIVIQLARHFGNEVCVFSRGDRHRSLAEELAKLESHSVEPSIEPFSLLELVHDSVQAFALMAHCGIEVDRDQYLWAYKRFRNRPEGEEPFYKK